jgi:hypothetical protein
MATVAVQLTSESLTNVRIPAGNKYFCFKIYGKAFALPISKLFFLAPILAEFFLSAGKCFAIRIEDSDKENSLFKEIDNSSVIESFKILNSLLNGFRPSISELLYKALFK